MSEIYANLGNICGICVREPPQSHLWGTLGGWGVGGVALGGWWDWGWSLLNAAFSNKIYDYNRPWRPLRGTKSKISVYFFVTRITIRNFAPINI